MNPAMNAMEVVIDKMYYKFKLQSGQSQSDIMCKILYEPGLIVISRLLHYEFSVQDIEVQLLEFASALRDREQGHR